MSTKATKNNWYQMKLRLLREENARLKELVHQLAAAHSKGAH